MAALQQQGQSTHWRDTLIQKSEAISDAWEVAKAYAGRFAEWILFGCMIINIIEMLPGIAVPALLSNIVLGIQVVMLDVGGFALASMADHARRMGDEGAANKAESTGKFLIGLMIVTLLVVAIGVLFPDTLVYVSGIEKALILVRVVMTVVYGHVIHSLRSSGENILVQHQEQTGTLQSEITRLQQLLATSKREANETQSRLQREITQVRNESDAVLASLREQIITMERAQHSTLETAEGQTALVAHLQNQLQSADQRLQNLTANLSQKQRDLQLTETALQTANAELQTAKVQITELQNAVLQTAKSQPDPSAKQTAKMPSVKPGNVTQLDQERAKREGKAKLSHAEVLAFKTAHPELKNAEVAAKLGISERKVYDAIAWQREQESANADEVAQ